MSEKNYVDLNFKWFLFFVALWNFLKENMKYYFLIIILWKAKNRRNVIGLFKLPVSEIFIQNDFS